MQSDLTFGAAAVAVVEPSPDELLFCLQKIQNKNFKHLLKLREDMFLNSSSYKIIIAYIHQYK